MNATNSKLPGKHLLLCLLFILSGCATSNPQESDLLGTWEATGLIPYSLLEYEDEGEAYLVLPADGEMIIVTLRNFTSRESDFTLLATYEIDDEFVTEEITGELFGTQLALHMNDSELSEEYVLWFTRTEIFDDYRDEARGALEELMEERD